jgi:NAD+ synthase (glutamine-hydrolysing)
MTPYGFARVTVCSPVVTVGNPKANCDAAIAALDAAKDSDVVVFPELHMSGYTCGDLFRSETLLKAVLDQTLRLALSCQHRNQLVVVGAPVAVGGELFNCAVAINGTKFIGIVPKTNIPNYGEFEESRWFRSGRGVTGREIKFLSSTVRFGTDLLFQWRVNDTSLVVGVEVCEDLWMPIPPSSHQALAGANLLVNLSASNETVGKCEYRVDLVRGQSGRCIAAYAYASAGPSESTTDLVFGGHCLIAENGSLVAESMRVGSPDEPMGLGQKLVTADVDIERVQNERRTTTSFGDASREDHRFRVVSFQGQGGCGGKLLRRVNGRPFVPSAPATLDARCAEVFGIQCAGLYKRLDTLNWPDVNIGVSGGLDSTLALLVAARCYRKANQPLSKIRGVTMPGYGTTGRTKKNAVELMTNVGCGQQEIDIRAMALRAFSDIGHKPFGLGLDPDGDFGPNGAKQLDAALAGLTPEQLTSGDLVFENVQARLRTFVLMSRGFVIGTGDLSELALGWCTYNGDHMSMYNVNASVPKTLVRFLVEWVAEHEARKIGDPSNKLYATLMDIVATPISPELLPAGKDGQIVQTTEDHLGPYELHDFYLRHFVRDGFSPDKILFLAEHAEALDKYTEEQKKKAMKVFVSRFFGNQFKRNCVPDGPKVGSVSLTPRNCWRMPSDADKTIWMENL